MVFEPVINSHKIKFKLLDKMFSDFYFASDRVNIFINLDSILSEFYREDLISSFMNLKGYENIALSSEIMNIAAHYRKYFYTRHKKTTFIYFYYMNKKPKKNMAVYPDYCKSIIERKNIKGKYEVFNNILKDNLRLLSLLSMYVPQVYFLLSDGYEPSLVPYNIMNNSICDNIVLTKDPYEYQFVSYPNTYVLRLKYDKSVLLNRKNLIDYILKDNKYKPNNYIDGIIYELILPYLSCKKRDLKGIKGKGKVNIIKKIDKLITNKKFPKFEDLSFNSLYKILDLDVDYDEIKSLYTITNISYQYNRLSKKDKINLEEFLIDRYENRTIMQINSTYYLNNPVQLIELWEGVQY